MRLYLTRHGETVWHHENRYAGVSDIALTERGRHQATQLAAWAKGAGLDAVYSSDLTRAVETAAPAAQTAGLPLRRDARLREVHFGDGEGLTRGEMRTRFPTDLDAHISQPASCALPAGERGLDAIARALPALDDIERTHPSGVVLVVMHSTLMRLLLCTALGVDPDRYRALFPRVRNGALTELQWQGGQGALLGFNVTPSA